MAYETIHASSRARIRLCWLLVVLALPRLATAATIVVPADQPTIQAAVTRAAAGDTILVQPGTYTETVRIADGRHGLTLAAANPEAPPTLVAGNAARDVDILVDRTDDVTLRDLVLRGGAEGVRVDHAYGVTLTGVHIEDAGIGIRLRRGGRHSVLASSIVSTRAVQGIQVDASPEVQIRNVTVDGAGRNGIVARFARGVRITDTTVSNVRARNGILVIRSANAAIVNCTSRRNGHDGIRVLRSIDIQLRRNNADDNGNVGVRLDRSNPFPTTHDVTAAGNEASANARRDVVVTRPDCRRHPCPEPTPGPVTTPTTTVATTTTTTTVTTTTAVTSTVPSTTITTPPTTSTTQPAPIARWRLYVRIALTGHAPLDVNVPLRSTDPALAIDVPARLLPAFRVGDQVSAEEIAALGANLLDRFASAATAHILANGGDYPGFAGVDSVRWTKRVDP